jgi:hypothetical protein
MVPPDWPAKAARKWRNLIHSAGFYSGALTNSFGSGIRVMKEADNEPI